jgi:hypothetical protein
MLRRRSHDIAAFAADVDELAELRSRVTYRSSRRARIVIVHARPVFTFGVLKISWSIESMIRSE